MGKEINIQIIDKCQLKCKWCARKWIRSNHLKKIEKRYMNLPTFLLVIDKCIESGIDEFCLTPKMGELFIDNEIFTKLSYLEVNKKVTKYFFSTNFLSLDTETILQLLTYKKLFLDISIYGHDRESYKENTGFDLFDKFEENLGVLFKLCKHSKLIGIKFTIRYPTRFYKFPYNRIKNLLTLFQNLFNCEIDESEMYNFNWCGLIPYKKLDTLYGPYKKHGVCPTAKVGCILHNGDFALCYMNDVYNTTIIDNILNKSLDDIYNSKKYKKIIENQKKDIYTGICKKCDERWDLWQH